VLEELVEQPLKRNVGIGNPVRPDLSDADLVHELLGNRPEAQRLVVRRFAPLVRGLLRRSLGLHHDLEDAEQEVFLSLFRCIESLRDPRSLRPFIVAITFRTALHERRRYRKLAAITLESGRIGPATERDEVVASYALIRLGKLVLRLHERERKTFVLRFVEGMTVSEIAGALEISEATTRRSFNRAWSFVNKLAARDPFLYDYFGAEQPLHPLDAHCESNVV
jgi:RNA polymerase sigma-70 factor, ECF subfamily